MLQRILILILCLLGLLTQVQAQDPNLNHSKYWFYRYRLLNEFMVKGEGVCGVASGKSMPADKAYYNDIKAGQEEVETVSWGDGTSHLGYYIGVLATEFALLSRNSAPSWQIDSVKHELYLAMKAYERVDKSAETLFYPHNDASNVCDSDPNGWFSRDDVPASIVEGLRDQYVTFEKGEQKIKVKKKATSSYIDHAGKTSWDGSLGLPVSGGGLSEALCFPSQDQIIDLMVGFALVTRTMPGVSYNGYDFVGYAQYYTDKMLMYAKRVGWINRVPGYGEIPKFGSAMVTNAYAFERAGSRIATAYWGGNMWDCLNNLQCNPGLYSDLVTSGAFPVWDAFAWPQGDDLIGHNYSTGNTFNNGITAALAAIGSSWEVGLVAQNQRLLGVNFNWVPDPTSWGCGNCTHWWCEPECCDCGFSAQMAVDIGLDYSCYHFNGAPALLSLISTELESSNESGIRGLGQLGQWGAKIAEVTSLPPLLCTLSPEPLPSITVNTTAISLSRYADEYELQLYAEMHKYLHNQGNYSYSPSLMENKLNSAPCTGPHIFPLGDPNTPSTSAGVKGWRSENSWQKPTQYADAPKDQHCAWSGLDYMLAYNLHTLNQGTSGISEGYKNEKDYWLHDVTYPYSSIGSDVNQKRINGFETITADNVTIANGSGSTNGNVVFHAGSSIKMKNMKIKNGANFKAYIDPIFPCLNNDDSNGQYLRVAAEEAIEPDSVKDHREMQELAKELVNKIVVVSDSMAKRKSSLNYVSVNEYVKEDTNKLSNTSNKNILVALNKIVASPNPFSEQILVKINSEKSDKVSVSLTNIIGVEFVLSKGIPVSSGYTEFSLDNINVPSGVYMLSIIGTELKQTIKMIKL